MSMTVTPDRIPAYLLLLDNDGWYNGIFGGSVIGDPLMEAVMDAVALNLPAPLRERTKEEKVTEAASAPAVSMTRWLIKWKTELVDEHGESLLPAWTTKHVTALLRDWGWLDERNLPTPLGLDKGISTSQGIRSNGEIYVYSVYSAEAAQNVLDALMPYFQVHHYSVEGIELPEPKRKAAKEWTLEELRELVLPKLAQITIPKPLSMAMWMKKLKNEVFISASDKTLLRRWGTKHMVALLRQWGWLGSNDLPTPLGLEKDIRVSTNYPGKRPFVVYSLVAMNHVVTRLCEYLAVQGLSYETILLTGNDEVEDEADSMTETEGEVTTAAVEEAPVAPAAMPTSSTAPVEAYALVQCLRRWQTEHPENHLLKTLSPVAINRRLASLGWLVTDKEGNRVSSDYGKSLGLVLASQRDPVTQKTRRYALFTPSAIPLAYEQVIQLMAARRRGRRGW